MGEIPARFNYQAGNHSRSRRGTRGGRNERPHRYGGPEFAGAPGRRVRERRTPARPWVPTTAARRPSVTRPRPPGTTLRASKPERGTDDDVVSVKRRLGRPRRPRNVDVEGGT